MLDITKIRSDFPMLQNKKMQGHDLIYFDNAATALKPHSVLNAIAGYYLDYTSNAHRGDYDLAYQVDTQYEGAREVVAQFIHAEPKEIVFTTGTTMGLNIVAHGLGENYLQKGDEVILNIAEHASNILPWLHLEKTMGIVIRHAPLDEHGRVTLEAIQSQVNEHTKVIAIAQVSNVLGYLTDIKAICAYAHQHDILVVVDGAQSVPHMKVDVKDLDCDFLAFSGHKLCGPTGIGVLYGKYQLLDQLPPLLLGGGMNVTFACCKSYELKKPPFKFEAGTPLIEGVIGLKEAILYLQSIGMEQIHQAGQELKNYAISQLKSLKNVTLYNEQSEGALVTFNITGVFAQDAASYFNFKGIAIRSGEHCAKVLKEFLKTPATLRASFYFYNTKEEVDQFVEVCKRGDEFLDAYF